MATKPLELAGLIKSLRAELIEAQAEGEGKDIGFQVEDIEIELEVAAEKNTDGTIGAKFYVFTSQFKRSEKDVVTQKLRLSLKPHQRVTDPDNGEPSTVPAMIAGQVKARP